MTVRDDFDADELDRAVWFPHYLPAWSSRARTKASYELADSHLRLFVARDACLWCPDEHPEPLRVSGVQSGNYSGPLGSTAGQQRFRAGLTVREEQTRFEGWLPASGRVAICCRMTLSPRSMAAMWLSGFEQDPDDAGELCVVEVFGSSVKPKPDGTAEIGIGVKALNDPRLSDDLVAPRLPVDVTQLHTYAVEWGDDGADFFLDGERLHRSAQAPTYPLQVMIAVFDFPARSTGDDERLVPELVVDWVEGEQS